MNDEHATPMDNGSSQDQFNAREIYNTALILMNQVMHRASKHASLQDLERGMHELIGRINTELKQHQELSTCLVQPFRCAYFTGHIINTCILSLMLGRGLKLRDSELAELGLCALFHDVGMGIILKESVLLNKEVSLPFDEVKRHPELGVQYLRELGLSERILRVAEQHHERINGSGYPKGLKGAQVDYWAQIIGLADLYDCFLHPRNHRQYRRKPADLFRPLIAQQGLFDPRLVKLLINHIGLYPIGTWVKLSTGAIGKVCRVTIGDPLRPTVDIFEENSEILDTPRRLDLKQSNVISIKQVVDPLHSPDEEAP